MATKIKDDFELQVSREAIERLQRALEGVKRISNPDIRQMCADSTHFMIEKIEREIEEYLAAVHEVTVERSEQKAAETSAKQTWVEAASASSENS